MYNIINNYGDTKLRFLLTKKLRFLQTIQNNPHQPTFMPEDIQYSWIAWDNMEKTQLVLIQDAAPSKATFVMIHAREDRKGMGSYDVETQS